MLRFLILASFLFISSSHGQGYRQPIPVRYKPIVQTTEAVDVADITFTTPSPDSNLYSSNRYETKGRSNRGLFSPNEAYKLASNTYPTAFKYKKDPYELRQTSNTKRPPTRSKVEPIGVKTAPITFHSNPEEEDEEEDVRPRSSKFKTVIGEPKPVFNQEPYGAVVGAPADILKQYSNNINKFPKSAYPGKLPATPYGFPAESQDYNSNGSDGFFNSDVAITKNDLRKFEGITEGPTFDYNQKELYSKKHLNKKKYYPKKYYPSSLKKVNSKIKVRPVEDVQEFPISAPELDTPSTQIVPLKKAPLKLYKEESQSSNPFSAELSAFHGSHTDGPGESGAASFPISANLGSKERVEFQMYGMDGPHSYKFGYDTGEGHFRFEERDNNGKVKGHYGYYDKDGKMRIMKYEADPETGFRAGPVNYGEDGENKK